MQHNLRRNAKRSILIALLGSGKAAGIAVGTEVGTALTVLRTGDGRNASVPYFFRVGPGEYQVTPGGPDTPVTPWLAQMRTFAIESSSQFRADGPPDLTSAQGRGSERNEVVRSSDWVASHSAADRQRTLLRGESGAADPP